MDRSRRGIMHFNRRLFLKGAAGALVGLPLLETFLPSRASPADTAQQFAIFMRQGNGVQQGLGTDEPDRFWPSKLGALTTASMQADGDRAVNELSAFASKLLIVRGCEMEAYVDAGCGHSQGGLLCLTAARANGKNIEHALATGESIDNRIERELSGAGREPLTLRAGQRSGYLDDVLSYRAGGDRRVAESNPFSAYKNLFGLVMDDNDVAKTAARQKSVNDLVGDEMAALLANKKLSKGDRYRLEQHSQAIRDLEVGIQCSLPPDMFVPLSQVTTARAESGDEIETITRMHCDVLALAVACGRVRAATLQIGNGNDQTQYTVGQQKYERFHHISHRVSSDGADGAPIANAELKHHDLDKLFARLFRYLLSALDKHKTPTGTLLDEGVAVWLNDLSNGPPHSTRNMPYVCAGSCGNKLRTGVYVDAGDVASDKFVTHNKFLNTLGAAVGCKNAAGAPLDDFGDGELEPGLISKMMV